MPVGALLPGPAVPAILAAVLLVGLPLLVAAAAVAAVLRQEREASAGSDEPWWHAHAAHAMDADQAVAGGSGQRLMGGSRPVALPSCGRCGKADPEKRCAGCSSVAYCSRECQQEHWKAGHKHDCKKLRKQRQAEARRAAAGEANGSAGGAGDGAAAAASEAKQAGSTERPEESNSTPPLPKQVLYPPERYAELAAAPPQRKAPLGLANVGNSCYANSLLQSLIATPALAAYLVSGEHSRGCLKPSANEWCALCELEKLAQQAYSKGSGCLSPKPLLKNVKRLGKQFSFGRQEDSHELYLRLMEAIEAVQLVEAGGKARFDLRSRETVLIHHVYGGYTRNQVACRSCGHVSRTYEACTSLTLEVSARVTSLEAALQRFAAVERLDGDNKYKCDGCKSYVAADKSTRIEAAPHNLNICLKRFAPGRYGKITTRLTFPETLDLSPYMAEGNVDAASGSGPPRYSLYAVVVHIDWARSTDYGHYIAYVKNGGTWFQCDDSTVTPVAAAKALSAGAYMLFYEREAPRRILTADEAAAAVPAKAAVAADSAASAAKDGAAVESAASAASAAADAAGSGEEAGSSEEAVSQQGGMLRVETAPASLPHLGAVPSSSSLSAASSQELPVLREGQEARQHRAARAIEAGTPEPLHASVSESDLQAAQLRSGGLAGAACVTAASAASLGVPSAIAEEAAEEGGSPSTRLEQQQRELAAAAAEARSEVEALLQQRASPSGASSGGSSPRGGSSSGGRSSEDFRPTANPYNLLGPEDSGEDSDSGGSRSSSSGSSGDDSGSGAAEAAAGAGAEVAGLSSTSGGEEDQLLSAAAKPASEPADVPAAVPDASAAAEDSASKQTAEPPAAEQQASTQDGAAAEDGAGKQAAEQQAAEQQASTQDGTAAQAPAEEQPGPAGSRSSAPTAGDGQQGAAAGEPAAAQACAGDAAPDERPQPAAKEQPSASTTPVAAAVDGCTPAHRASLKSSADGKRVLRLSVDLPGVESMEHVDWQLQARGSRAGSSACQQLLLRAAQWRLALPLPVPVEGGSAAAKWARQKLTVTWPVV